MNLNVTPSASSKYRPKCFSLRVEGVRCTNSWFGMTVQDHKMAIFWLLLSMLCVHIFC